MSGEVFYLAISRDIKLGGLLARLEGMASIFRTIDAAELLMALPDCPHSKANHIAALNLLALVESELYALCEELAEENTP